MNPAINKLKIDKTQTLLVLNKPEYVQDFKEFSYESDFKNKSYDCIMAFIFQLKDFTDLVEKIIRQNLLNVNGYVYFAYPKKGNKIYKEYIGRDDFMPAVNMDNEGYVGNSDIKFNKMVAFDEVFTVIGLKNIPKRKVTSSKPSQCVADYETRIPEVQQQLAGNKPALELFNNLTPGYQRGWARYVFSAQSETTIQKRFAEMADILQLGFKSIDLFRQRSK